jgi:PhnB protein
MVGVPIKGAVMASRLNPYVSFAGDARQAMEFYAGVFGGTLDLRTFGQYGDPTGDGADNIMHGQLDSDAGFTLMCADAAPGTEREPGNNNMSISLSGDDVDMLRGYWEKLAEGGTVFVPLEKQMWGDEFGMCADKFGIPWMVNITAAEA